MRRFFGYIENAVVKDLTLKEAKVEGKDSIGTLCGKVGAPDKPCGVGRADANPKLLLNDT